MIVRHGAPAALLVMALVGLGCDGCRRTVPGTDGNTPSDSDIPGVDGGPDADGGNVEICDNGIDDDGDPFIDCDDFDCESDPACVMTVTIRDVQDLALRAAAGLDVGSIVTINDVVVTGVEITSGGMTKSFFIQETTGAPEYSGVFVFIPTGKVGMFPVAVGDIVSLTGEIDEFDGLVGPETVTELSFVSSVTVASSGNPLPAHAVVTAANVGTGGANHEEFEGVLVDVGGVTVTAIIDAANLVFEVDSSLQVDPFLFDYVLPGLADDFTNLRGILTFNGFEQQAQLLPGSVADMTIVLAVAEVTPTPSVVEALGTTTLTARLNAAAGAGGQAVCVTASDPAVTVPAMVTVPAGTATAPITVTDTGVAIPLLVTISATVAATCPAGGPADATAGVWFDAVGTAPALMDLTPDPLTAQVSLLTTMTVVLDIAPPAGSPGVSVTLTSSDPSAVTAPPSVLVPAGSTMAMFDVTGLTVGGMSTITATLGAGVQTSVVTVTDVTGVPVTALALSEVLYDVTGGDAGMEWVEIYNGSGADIDLTGHTIQNAGTTYAVRYTFPAGTTIMAGECLMVGPGAGTFVGADLQNSCGATGTCAADAIALVGPMPTLDFLDVVIYGPPGSNTSSLVDEDGAIGEPDVADAPPDSSIERVGPSTWRVRPSAPTPGDCSIIE